MNTLQITISLSVLNNRFDDQTTKNSRFFLQFSPPRGCNSVRRGKAGYRSMDFSQKLSLFGESTERFQILKKKRCSDLSFFGASGGKAQVLKKKRSVAVRVNQGFNFNGGNRRNKSNNARILGNLALAIGLTYLSMTGQLGWILDAIVSIWIFVVLLPIAGIGVFLWYAGRDIIQGSCPNCGNDFQILKSSLKDGTQLCPFCSQPFSVQGKDFVRESAKFSTNQSSTFRQAFNGFSPRSSSERGKSSSGTIVDVEAEVKDVD